MEKLSNFLFQNLVTVPGDIHLSSGRDEDDDDAAVAQEGQQEDDPDGAAQGPPVKQVVAR